MNLDKKTIRFLQKEANNQPIEHQRGNKSDLARVIMPIAMTLRNKGMTWASVSAWFAKKGVKINHIVLCNLASRMNHKK